MLGLGLAFEHTCALGPFYTDSWFYVIDVTAWIKMSNN
jgi:hypothetical protein